MRLFKHPDFEQAVIRAAKRFRPRGLRAAVIEEDYCVTEVPRASLRLATTGDRRRNPRAGGAVLLPGPGLQRVGRSPLQPG